MAILKGIEVSVVIDGKALTEYDDEYIADQSPEHPSEVSKYVEAVSDAEFSIGITVPSSYDFAADCLAFRLSLDGVWVRTSLCRKAKLKRLRKDWHRIIAGSKVKNGEEWYLRPFKFNDINIVEASTSTAGGGKSNSVTKLGTITLKVFEKEVTGKSHNVSTGAVSLGQSSEIAENELKGKNLLLQSSFGESRLSKGLNRHKSKFMNEKPILSFEFNYRSKKALQCLRLIPMTPSPSPMLTPVPLEERPFDSLTPDELQELARKLHARYQAEREANIKLEKTKSERGIKREGNIKPEKTKSEHGVKKESDQHGDLIESSTAKRGQDSPFRTGRDYRVGLRNTNRESELGYFQRYEQGNK